MKDPFKWCILCFELSTIKYEIYCPWEGVFKVAGDERYLCPVAMLFQKNKKKKRWEDDLQKLFMYLERQMGMQVGRK